MPQTPSKPYKRPANLFVAVVIGSPQMNFLPGAAAPSNRFGGDDLRLFGFGRDNCARLDG